MPRVEIVQMGPPIHDLNLRGVARTANRVQNHFIFDVGDPINTIGEPCTNEGEYKAGDLAILLEKRRQDGAEFEVGITDVPLFDELFSGVDNASRNIVISLAPIESLLPRINKSKADYVLLEIAAQLLTTDYRRQADLSVEPEVCALPWHKETRSCVFDYCDNPPETLKKLMAPKLCSVCRSLLESANIRESVITACLNIVKKAVYAKFINVLRGVLNDPISRLLFGGLFTLLAVEISGSLGLPRVLTGMLILALLLGVMLKHFRKSRTDLL
jgi:hypothetical protein